ncbi:hypothetical protein BGZ65_005586 [Modicella reniformis]|uniref:Uncharacterized protein n=1 Tax=Modicella reniformis TaxID=1440133 RepID=A0A9P6JHK5_9FUNG|nr:hypothetical protein BGZ65_005586 [Modicella reniformis]
MKLKLNVEVYAVIEAYIEANLHLFCLVKVDAEVIVEIKAAIKACIDLAFNTDIDAIAIDLHAPIELIVKKLVVNVDTNVLAKICATLQVAGLIDANVNLDVQANLNVDVLVEKLVNIDVAIALLVKALLAINVGQGPAEL